MFIAHVSVSTMKHIEVADRTNLNGVVGLFVPSSLKGHDRGIV